MTVAQLPCFKGANVVIVSPHPDDESLATGGLIQTALANGARVAVIMLTDGDRNPWPQRFVERRWHIGVQERARWAMRRRAEAACALAVLGVDASAVHSVCWPDMGITELVVDDCAGTVHTFAELLARLIPTSSSSSILVLPALADRHPDHGAAHVVARLAIAQSGLLPHVLSYMVHGQAGSSATELHLDDASRQRKQTAVQQHQTQLALSRRRMLRYAARAERYSVDFDNGPASIAPSHVLPWRIGPAARRLCDLLVVAPAGACRLPLARAPSAALHTSNDPRVTERAGILRLDLPESLQRGPVYAKLVTRLASPWIFDHWGWARVKCE